MSECVKNVVSWVSQVGDKVGKGTSALIDALPSLKEDHHVVMVRLFCSCLCSQHAVGHGVKVEEEVVSLFFVLHI